MTAALRPALPPRSQPFSTTATLMIPPLCENADSAIAAATGKTLDLGRFQPMKARILFWLFAILLFLITIFALLRPLLRSSNTIDTTSNDMQVYKDQLDEIASDVARDIISKDDAQSLQAEISRRLLKAADDRSPPRPPPSCNPKLISLTIAAVLTAFSFLFYAQLGTPTLPDAPFGLRLADVAAARAMRPSQDQAEISAALAPVTINADDLALLQKLEAALASRPNDLRGHELLAQTQAQLGLWTKARVSQQQVLRIKGDAATGPDHFLLGEYMVYAANGNVSPEAEQAFASGLTLDPQNPRGRYFSGLALAQGGRPDLAFRLWSGLLAEGPPDAPWIAAIQNDLPQLARDAGRPMPEFAAGPDAAAIAQAAEMSQADRTAMIGTMVQGLATRLQSQGGTVEEWAQLIRAYGVLGETANASKAWEQAKTIFAGDQNKLALLLQAAQTAEIAN